MSDIYYKEESFRIIGVCMEIHKSLGLGLKEISYKDAMEIDFIERGVNFQREKRFTVKYKGKQLRNPYIADFVINDEIVLEIKSSASIIELHLAQALSYLAVAGLKLAIIINFGEKSLTWKRVLL
jgi:GxxExxY protein